MLKHRIKIILLLAISLIVINTVVYYATELNKEQRIKISLDDNLKNLQIHYEILLHHQKVTAHSVYISTITMIPNFLEIFSKLQTASHEEKAILRAELYNKLIKKYEVISQRGVLQYQFVLPNNESFLRMHKPDKFGDDLTKIRRDFKYVNETKKSISEFSQGRTAHGFRNVYPILNKNGTHLGAMEVSFSSNEFQQELTTISKIHTHFLVDKKIFDTKSWSRDDLVLSYVQSAEHDDFMLTFTQEHTKKTCITENKKKLYSVKDDIDRGIKKGDKFALYTIHEYSHIDVISFFPIKNHDETETLAWLVSYEANNFIYTTIKTNIIIRIILFFIFLIFGYLIFKQISSQQIIKQDHRLVNDVLNSTDDIMFATDFKEVTFSNRKFRDFFDVKDTQEFNNQIKGNIISLFVNVENHLYAGLLTDSTTFPELITDTTQENRVVTLLDKSLNKKVFNINLTKTNYDDSGNYLVTLTDITKLKEKELYIQHKAYTDQLTQVYNRNKFDEIAQSELNRNIRYKRSLCMAIIDIDHFKNFNDTYGHLVGDEVLVMLAQNLNNKIRVTDTFARWGGEEFVILFPETSIDDAIIICNKLRVGIQKLLHPDAGSITASFGVTQYQDGDTTDSMFKRCDSALYEAKKKGRNMVCSN